MNPVFWILYQLQKHAGAGQAFLLYLVRKVADRKYSGIAQGSWYHSFRSATLAGLPGLSSTNFSQLRQFLSFNPDQTTTIDACNLNLIHGDCLTANIITVDGGTVNIPSPNFFKHNHVVINLDYNQSQDTLHHWLFLMTNGSDFLNTASQPIFFVQCRRSNASSPIR